MGGLRTWFSTSRCSPRTETLGWFVSIGRKPSTLEETSLRSFTELQSWCEDHSDLQLGLHHFSGFSVSCCRRESATVQFVASAVQQLILVASFLSQLFLGQIYMLNPFLLSIIKAEIFLLFYMVLDCSVSCHLFYMAIFCWINVYFMANCGI